MSKAEEKEIKQVYVIAEGSTAKVLSGAVNRLIDQGYKPHGNVILQNHLLQPMILNTSPLLSLNKTNDDD